MIAVLALVVICASQGTGAFGRLPPPDDAGPAIWQPRQAQLRTARASERYYRSLDRAVRDRAAELHCEHYHCLTA